MIWWNLNEKNEFQFSAKLLQPEPGNICLGNLERYSFFFVFSNAETLYDINVQ